jgi:hypothetical protein
MSKSVPNGGSELTMKNRLQSRNHSRTNQQGSRDSTKVTKNSQQKPNVTNLLFGGLDGN